MTVRRCPQSARPWRLRVARPAGLPFALRPSFSPLGEGAGHVGRSGAWNRKPFEHERGSLRFTPITPSQCASRKSWSVRSLKPTVARIGAKDAPLEDIGRPTNLSEPSLSPRRPPVRVSRAGLSLAHASSKLRGARASLRDASSWLTRPSLRPTRARPSLRDISSWLTRPSLKLTRARASLRDASSWLTRASSDRARSRLASTGASLKLGRTRERHGSRLLDAFCASFELARAFLKAARASLKLEDAPEGESHTFLKKRDRAHEEFALRLGIGCLRALRRRAPHSGALLPSSTVMR